MLSGVIPSETLDECRRAFALRGTLGQAAPEPGRKHVRARRRPQPNWDKGEEDIRQLASAVGGPRHGPVANRHGPVRTHISLVGVAGHRADLPFDGNRRHVRPLPGAPSHRRGPVARRAPGRHGGYPEVPLSIWIPLGEVAPRSIRTGLHRTQPRPHPAGRLLQRRRRRLPHGQSRQVWVPHYHAGDLTIHSRYSPHFTTGYGTHSSGTAWRSACGRRKTTSPSTAIPRSGSPVATAFR